MMDRSFRTIKNIVLEERWWIIRKNGSWARPTKGANPNVLLER